MRTGIPDGGGWAYIGGEVVEAVVRESCSTGYAAFMTQTSLTFEDYVLLASDDDLKTYKEAMARSDAELWEVSIGDELKSMKDHNVWMLIPRSSVPPDQKIIPSKIHFATKHNSENVVTRHKSCFVAKGFAQIPGIDFTETYAPVTRLESMCAILHIGANLDWEIHQMDIKTAFLHGDLKEEIYMEQPEGAKECGKEDWVCLMHKSLYGLMQGARNWNVKLNNVMVNQLGYHRLAVDHCVYTRSTTEGTSMIAVHVDDMCVAASSPTEMARLKSDLGKCFDLVDLGEVKWLLGIGITRDRKTRTINLSQRVYIEQIAARFNLQDSHPVHNPCDSDTVLSKDMCPKTISLQNAMKKVP